MNRILFAAGRGARVQWSFYPYEPDKPWVEIMAVPTLKSKTPERWRIHPSDTHLAYGPVSTALRNWAVMVSVPLCVGFIERTAKDYVVTNLPSAAMPPSIEHRSLFLLILSEALCDDGL